MRLRRRRAFRRKEARSENWPLLITAGKKFALLMCMNMQRAPILVNKKSPPNAAAMMGLFQKKAYYSSKLLLTAR